MVELEVSSRVIQSYPTRFASVLMSTNYYTNGKVNFSRVCKQFVDVGVVVDGLLTICTIIRDL